VNAGLSDKLGFNPASRQRIRAERPKPDEKPEDQRLADP
jgi:hypothetical protein